MKIRTFFAASYISAAFIALAVIGMVVMALLSMTGCRSHKEAAACSESLTLRSDSVDIRSHVAVYDSVYGSESVVFSFDSLRLVSVSDVVPSASAGRDGSPALSVAQVKGGKLVIRRDVVADRSVSVDKSVSLHSDSVRSDSVKESVPAQAKKKQNTVGWSCVLIALILAGFAVIYYFDRYRN